MAAGFSGVVVWAWLLLLLTPAAGVAIPGASPASSYAQPISGSSSCAAHLDSNGFAYAYGGGYACPFGLCSSGTIAACPKCWYYANLCRENIAQGIRPVDPCWSYNPTCNAGEYVKKNTADCIGTGELCWYCSPGEAIVTFALVASQKETHFIPSPPSHKFCPFARARL